jgi:hypothetical protein
MEPAVYLTPSMISRVTVYRSLMLVAVGLAAGRSAVRLVRMGYRGEVMPLVTGQSPSLDPNEQLIREVESAAGRLRPFLPSRGRIGYCSRVPNEKLLSVGFNAALERFVVWQYALVPVLVVADDRRPLVLGDFPDSVALAAFASERGCAPVTSQGGVGLLSGCRPRS